MITIVGELYDPLGCSWNGHHINVAELRSRQEGPIALTLDHDQVVGQVLSLARVRGGSVHAIAIAEGGDELIELDTPIYFSPTTDTRARDGGDGRLIEVALTFHTARVAARPVVVKAGDVRKPGDRNRWRLNGIAAELVPRAAEEIRCRPKGGPLHVRDVELEKALARENRNRPSYIPRSVSTGRGEAVAPQTRVGFQRGGIEWSGHRGAVIAVR
jgi:hypothetical protein